MIICARYFLTEEAKLCDSCVHCKWFPGSGFLLSEAKKYSPWKCMLVHGMCYKKWMRSFFFFFRFGSFYIKPVVKVVLFTVLMYSFIFSCRSKSAQVVQRWRVFSEQRRARKTCVFLFPIALIGTLDCLNALDSNCSWRALFSVNNLTHLSHMVLRLHSP